MMDSHHQKDRVLLSSVLIEYCDLEFAVLVGSRAENRSRPDSGWDIAIQWKKGLSTLENFSQAETLRRDIANHLSVNEELIDLIHLPSASSAMRALVAEKGIEIIGQGCLAWNHFLSRTWRELEDDDWGKQQPLTLYQAEIIQIAKEQSALLEEARDKLLSGETLSRLEGNGVLHAYQVLIENAISKAKQLLKAENEPVPLSAYDVFTSLVRIKKVSTDNLDAWNAAIGLRNRIVHEYMNIEIKRVLELVRTQQHQFITDFLLAPIKLS